MSFRRCPKDEYRGLFRKTGVCKPLEEQAAALEIVFAEGAPYRGLTIRFGWRLLEPDEGRFLWEGMDRLVELASRRGLFLTIEPLAGWFTPDWVCAKGARGFEILDQNPAHSTFGQRRRGPIPWDARLAHERGTKDG